MEIYTTAIFSIILYVIAEKCFNYLKILSEFLAIHDLYEFHAIFTEHTTYIVIGKIEVLSKKDENAKIVVPRGNRNNPCIQKQLFTKFKG